MRGFTWPIAALCLLFGSAGEATNGQTAAPARSPLELRISGPHLIHRGDKLKFEAVVVNHSQHPVAFAFRQGGWDCDGVFRWTITDAADRLLPTPPPEPVRGMMCCLTSTIREDEIVVLQPGEKREAPELSDPSDFYWFPGDGFYRVRLRLVFFADVLVNDGHGHYHYLTPDEVSEPKSNLELAVKGGRIDVTSNAWNVYLTD
jgi:hypothetical protein